MDLFKNSRRRALREYREILGILEQLQYNPKISDTIKQEIRTIMTYSKIVGFENASRVELVNQTEELKGYLKACTESG